jgi:hypothetical protein
LEIKLFWNFFTKTNGLADYFVYIEKGIMKTLYSILLLFLVLGACQPKEMFTSCAVLESALIDFDDDAAKTIFEEYCSDLIANVTTEDPHGHEENTNILIDRIINDCGFNIELLHYATIETFPTQSEIQFLFVSNQDSIIRVVDLLNDPDGLLAFNGIHE